MHNEEPSTPWMVKHLHECQRTYTSKRMSAARQWKFHQHPHLHPDLQVCSEAIHMLRRYDIHTQQHPLALESKWRSSCTHHIHVNAWPRKHANNTAFQTSTDHLISTSLKCRVSSKAVRMLPQATYFQVPTFHTYVRTYIRCTNTHHRLVNTITVAVCKP